MNPPKTAPEAESHVRVTVSEASRLFGVNPRTIRRALSAGELTYIVVRGRYKITFASLVSWSQHNAKRQNKRDQHGIGQWIETWRIRNTLYSPRAPKKT